MTTYHIYFVNRTKIKQNYGLFSEVPQLTGNTGGGPVYGNIFLSANLETDGDWAIGITKTYYAWCGNLPQQLAPGVSVSTGNGKLATLGTDTAPGSTWTMYNNSGGAAFEPQQTLTSNAGAFEIDSGTDFTPEQNFVIGLASLDDAGRMRPLAILPANPNRKVNIKPITRYWIGAFDSTVGTVIDTAAASKDCADINFSDHPGIFGAVVSQDSFGQFSVKYTIQLAFQLEVISSQAETLGSKWQLDALKKYIDVVQAHKAHKELSGSGGSRIRYQATLAIYGSPSPDIISKFFQSISTKFSADWFYEDGASTKTHVTVDFSHDSPVDLPTARVEFNSAYLEVPMATRYHFVDPHFAVIPTNQANGSFDGIAQEVPYLQRQKQLAMDTLQAQGLAINNYTAA